VAYLLKARPVEPEKQSLLGNGCLTLKNRVTVGCDVLCAVRAEAVYRGSAAITGDSLDGSYKIRNFVRDGRQPLWT
jgi:hypothetical protein